jgi:hypothetical protein
MTIKNYKTTQINNQTIIWFEENGLRYSFTEDLANADYQKYLQSLDNSAE